MKKRSSEVIREQLDLYHSFQIDKNGIDPNSSKSIKRLKSNKENYVYSRLSLKEKKHWKSKVAYISFSLLLLTGIYKYYEIHNQSKEEQSSSETFSDNIPSGFPFEENIKNVRITQNYGCTSFIGEEPLYRAPFSDEEKKQCILEGKPYFHNGIDIAEENPDPKIRPNLLSMISGKILEGDGLKRDDPHRGLGNWIEVDSSDGIFKVVYGHTDKYLVKNGEFVHKGQAIGKEGNSGYSTGYHVHVFISKNNISVNPNKFLTFIVPASFN